MGINVNQSNKGELNISLDIGDVRRSAEARQRLITEPAESGGKNRDGINKRGSAAPTFEQSYTGKGMLLDIKV